MRKQRSSGFGGPEWSEVAPGLDRDAGPRDWDKEFTDQNSPEEVFGEIGLVLIVVLGIVLAINVVLVSLHIA